MDTTLPGDTRSPILSDERQLAAFQECVEHGTPAVITPYEMTTACQAKFHSVQKRSVTFALLDNLDYHFPSVFSYCVAFPFGERTWLFLSRIRDFIPDPSSAPLLVLRMPPHVIGVDIRRTIRFNVARQSDLEVAMRTGSTVVTPKVLDIGLGGVQLEFDEDEDPKVDPGEAIGLNIYLGTMEVSIKAEVKHRDGCRYGLAFGAKDDPRPFVKIIRALEQQWFAELGEKWLSG